MKRYTMLFTALCLCLTGCGAQITEEPEPQQLYPPATTARNIQTFTDSAGTEIRLDRNRFSENARVLTGDDIWISSHRCGSLSQMPRNSRWIIRSQAELDCFNAMYDMHCKLPDEYPNHGDDVEMPYDFAHDAMLIEYAEVNSTGYDLKAGGVLIDGNAMNFVMSTDSQSPEPGEEVGEMMDGFLWEAALPQEDIPPDCDGWIYIYPQQEPPHESETSETEDIGDCYMKPLSDADIVTDEATGIRYVKNQLLVSCALGTDRAAVEGIADQLDAEIVGYIALTCDYQFEWKEDKTTDELQALADQLNSWQFVENVTLNMVSEIAPDIEPE